MIFWYELWYDSVQFAMFCWIWYDDSIWYDMICSVLMPEFFLFNSWRYHGCVIEAPMAWHFLWRCDWSTASPFDMICFELWIIMICMICFVGGAYGCILGILFCVGWMWVCAYTSSRLGGRASILVLRGLPSSCTYDLTDMWLYGRRPIRESR